MDELPWHKRPQVQQRLRYYFGIAVAFFLPLSGSPSIGVVGSVIALLVTAPYIISDQRRAKEKLPKDRQDRGLLKD